MAIDNSGTRRNQGARVKRIDSRTAPNPEANKGAGIEPGTFDCKVEEVRKVRAERGMRGGELMPASAHRPQPPLRLVLDTNIVVAGLLWNGPPRELQHQHRGTGEALVSLMMPTSVLRVVTSDAGDDHVIAAAGAARAELIVTGHRKHLLPIGCHQGIAIVTAREVIDRIDARSKTLLVLKLPSWTASFEYFSWSYGHFHENDKIFLGETICPWQT